MERFKVSGDDLRAFYKENIALSRVFSDIERDLQSSDQVVCQFIVNGLELSEKDEKRFSEVLLAEVETLEYLTENSEKIVGVVLRGWLEALPELMRNTELLSRKMRARGLSGLLKDIHDLLSNCEFLMDSSITIRSLMRAEGYEAEIQWFEVERVSKETVQQALNSLENKDFVLLADVLEYDLNHMLQLWFEELQKMEKIINGDVGTDLEHSGSYFMGRRPIAN